MTAQQAVIVHDALAPKRIAKRPCRRGPTARHPAAKASLGRAASGDVDEKNIDAGDRTKTYAAKGSVVAEREPKL